MTKQFAGTMADRSVLGIYLQSSISVLPTLEGVSVSTLADTSPDKRHGLQHQSAQKAVLFVSRLNALSPPHPQTVKKKNKKNSHILCDQHSDITFKNLPSTETQFPASFENTFMTDASVKIRA